jgi:hypothetical protein
MKVFEKVTEKRVRREVNVDGCSLALGQAEEQQMPFL